MSWFKYIFHRHKWRYFGHFPDQYIFTCAICHRDRKISIINENDYYNSEKIDKIRTQMENSVSHLH